MSDVILAGPLSLSVQPSKLFGRPDWIFVEHNGKSLQRVWPTFLSHSMIWFCNILCTRMPQRVLGWSRMSMTSTYFNQSIRRPLGQIIWHGESAFHQLSTEQTTSRFCLLKEMELPDPCSFAESQVQIHKVSKTMWCLLCETASMTPPKAELKDLWLQLIPTFFPFELIWNVVWWRMTMVNGSQWPKSPSEPPDKDRFWGTSAKSGIE